MIDVKISMVFQIIFGQYISVTSSKITSLLLRFYCLCLFTVTIYFSSKYLAYLLLKDTKACVYNAVFVINYIVTTIISQMSPSFVTTFTNSVLSCDHHMGHTKKSWAFTTTIYNLMLYICIDVVSFVCDLNLSMFWHRMLSLDINNVVYLLVHHLIHMSLVMSNLNTVIVVELLRNRLIMLRKTLKSNEVPVNIVCRAKIKTKLKVLKKCLRNYIDLFDAYANIQDHIQFRMFNSFAFCLPRLTFFGYNILKQLSFEPFQKRMSRFYYIDFVGLLVQMIAPCLMCELCRNEVNSLKILLKDQIVRSADEELREELDRSLEYVSRRPFSLTLLNKNVDIRLPFNLIGYSITYVTLMINFTKFVL